MKKIKIPKTHRIISLDVKSLYTNVGKRMVIKALEKRARQISKNTTVPFSEIIEATELLFDNTFFQFDKEFYVQIFGTPMGSPISGLFADMVMEDLESECLDKLSFSPTFFYRYVDDIITCVPLNEIDNILRIFNSYEERLQFTHEIELDNKINFLDVLIINNNGNLETDWYTKPTFSGRFLNFNSKHPISQKIALVYNLIDRAIHLSDKKFQEKNIEKVKSLLIENNYPFKFIEKYVKIRINKIKFSNVNQNKTNVLRSKKSIVLPYVKGAYERVSHCLKNYKIECVPKSNINLSNIIVRGKNKTKNHLENNVIYKVNCMDCDASYVGQTKRSFKIRKGEHKKQKQSVIFQHMQENHKFNWKNFKLLDKEKNSNKRGISEMVYINSQQRSLNKQEDTAKLSSQYCNLIHKFKSTNNNYII